MAARKLTIYSEARKELAVFEEKYQAIVPDCSTPKGMKSAKDCRKEIRDARSNLEDLRKETKAPVLAKGTQIDTEAKAIKEKLDALFTKFDDSIKAIENKAEIDAAKAAKAAEDKIHELEQREQAIRDKEIELGLREPDEEPADTDAGEDVEPDDSGDAGDDVSDSASSGSSAPSSADIETLYLNSSAANKKRLRESIAEFEGTADVETICEPHIKVAGERLKVLKKIRNLVEPTDAQPTGDIDADIAAQHDAVLADIWELVDVFK